MRTHVSDLTSSTPITAYTPGERVEVHAFGSWYPGEVVKVGRSKVTARYTSGSGVTREKACEPKLIRKVAP